MAKHRRARGSGTIRLIGRIWWIGYRGADGKRHWESSHSQKKTHAERLLLRRTGAREHNLPIVKYQEQLTFSDAARSLIDFYSANNKQSLRMVEYRITKHLKPFFEQFHMASINAS